ncbi:winged helix-turn-helix domain-containing protein [Pseudoalteromonas sp. McH1-7]|uniref:winged helix-turn-helix domain-containing protein n=1 Tax=Pseudoalteromonas TaxID=53246 RepID=UPI000FFF2A62|nr:MULTISPECIES: winged helix-turn-helix domain-containing protein [Pseudoalteromonas]MDW7549106.1 winged helix-turn-helix domain-containing protein [Pseudoalteromonas peptidolytica]NUZ09911.1 winged helix-turn-helix domain-containing protein [Pseudoalteromonas sp. McH1-7]RXF01547.1 hypothetical protein D9603_13225 [Pseudoalteromonas sp. PS5]USD31020.1 winged helix-turn-helix domain-containing protein [Pseudoalteromonas sp. SCSIO 43201]
MNTVAANSSDNAMELNKGFIFYHGEDYILSENQEVVKLEPLASKALLYLIEHSERAVSVEELLVKVWGSKFKSMKVVNRCVCLARKALADDMRNPKFIKTIPKRGYKFVGHCMIKNHCLELTAH